MISINICRAEAVRREGIRVLLIEYKPLLFPLPNCWEKLSDSSVIKTSEKSATEGKGESDSPGSLRTKF